MKSQKLLFIHVPKTGGASIRKMLKRIHPIFNYDVIHNRRLIKFIQNKPSRSQLTGNISISDYTNICYFVRNPYQRLLSCYRYFYNGGLNQYGKKIFKGDLNLQAIINKEFPIFEHCCFNLERFCNFVPHALPMTISLPSELTNSHPTQRIFQGRFENYTSDLKKFFLQMNISISNMDIVKINKSINIEDIDYSDEMKKQVYDFYKEDFEQFNYSQ